MLKNLTKVYCLCNVISYCSHRSVVLMIDYLRIVCRASSFLFFSDPSKPQDISPVTAVEEKYGHVPWLPFNQANREPYIEIGTIKNFYVFFFYYLF